MHRTFVEEWAEDAPRRKQAGVPDDIAFETKTAIALGLLKQALAQDIQRGFVLADAGYGSDTAFREAVTALGLPYVMGVGPTTSVWAPGVRPLAQVKPWSGKGPRPLLRLRRDDERKPTSVKELALNLPEQAWQVIEWREGTNDVLKGRFARVRVDAAHRRPNANRPSTGFRPCPKTSPSTASSTPSNCAGASNAIIRSSNRRSASAITKAADGAASTTTQHCASPLTDS